MQKSPVEDANFLSRFFFWWTSPLLRKGFKKKLELADVYKAPSYDLADNLSERLGRPPRNLVSCGVLGTRHATLPLPSACPPDTPTRSFINLVVPTAARRMDYSECRTLGYTPEQMYNVVASVDQYQHFVPWCKKSCIMKGRNGDVRAKLEIGFPPVVERYTSELTTVPNHQVRAVCTDASIFNHLETLWRFAPGPKDQPASCKVEFYVSFEFKSLLHTQLATMFFDEVVKKMVNAFERRAAALYGCTTVPPHRGCQ